MIMPLQGNVKLQEMEQDKAALHRELGIAQRRLEKLQLRLKNVEKIVDDPAYVKSGSVFLLQIDGVETAFYRRICAKKPGQRCTAHGRQRSLQGGGAKHHLRTEIWPAGRVGA